MELGGIWIEGLRDLCIGSFQHDGGIASLDEFTLVALGVQGWWLYQDDPCLILRPLRS